MSNPETIRSRFFPVHPENDIYAPKEAVSLSKEWLENLQGKGVIRNAEGKIEKYHVICLNRKAVAKQIGFLVTQELREVKEKEK